MQEKERIFLGGRMRLIREANHCSQEETAKRISQLENGAKLDKAAISRAEHGQCQDKTMHLMVERYCQAFALSDLQRTQLFRGERIVLPDTSALIYNPQLIDQLREEYALVVIAKDVLDELNRIKDRRNSAHSARQARKAWEILRSIAEGEQLVKISCSEDRIVPKVDDRIIAVAKKVSEQHCGEVDIITNDVDFAAYLPHDGHIHALHIADYMQNKQMFLDMDKLRKVNDYYAESYHVLPKLTPEEANAYLPDGNTLLIDAVRKKKIPHSMRKAKILWLIECGADVDQRDEARRYFPALTHAIQMNDAELCQFLLKRCKADPNIGSRNPRDYGKLLQKNEGNMPLMVAAWEGNLQIVRLLCEDKRTSVNQQDANGFTALMKACANGYFKNSGCQKDIESLLINYGADTRIVDRDGKTAEDWKTEYRKHGPMRERFAGAKDKRTKRKENRR